METTLTTLSPAAQAYAYIRLSSQSQTWGDGERRQHDAAMRFVETHGLHLSETLQDIGVSAFRGDNAQTGELGRFVQRIENGEIPPGSVLVAESLDRLTRNRVNEALLLLLKITQNGVRIGLTAQNVILDLASYAAFFPILADMMRSNSESEHKSFRSRANWQTKRKLAKEGVIVTSQVPRWLEVQDGKIHVLEDRAQLVRRIFDMYVGGYGRGVIARTLCKEGILPWNTRSAIWHESYIHKLLCNRAVVGEYIVAAVGIHAAELKQHANRIITLEGKLDHVAVSIQKFMTVLKNNALEDMEEIGQQLAELHQERRTLRDQLAQARAGVMDVPREGFGRGSRARVGNHRIAPARRLGNHADGLCRSRSDESR